MPPSIANLIELSTLSGLTIVFKWSIYVVIIFSLLTSICSKDVVSFDASFLISSKPVSIPIGYAPELQNLKPFQSLGLWEAVIINPGRFINPDNEYTTSVGTVPM